MTIKAQLSGLLLSKIDSTDDSINTEFISNLIEIPTDSSKGDFAFPCFKLAKAFRKAPPIIAKEIGEKITGNLPAALDSFEIVGGYLNFFINAPKLAATFFDKIADASFFIKPSNATRVMIEYSQPNTHKEFHVGHGRNVCLGDSITRLYKYQGFDTVPVNYIGDEGTHIAKCLMAVARSEDTIPATKRAQWLGSKYVMANNLLTDCSEDERVILDKEISTILAAIESKKGETYELWKKTREYCMEDFREVYKWLNVDFDHYFYESDVSEASQKVVNEYLDKGVFKISQGAVGIDMSDEKLGFMMVRKSDGNSLYITKDIALAHTKFEEWNINKNIYIVANEQDYHFKQLFNFFKIANFKEADKCEHLSYGMVTRPEGKMSSRSGNSFTFFQLVEIIIEELKKHMTKHEDQWPQDQIDETVHKLAVGAIKHGMLSTDPAKEIIFDPEKWVRFDGNSGPYLMYGYARSRSIIEKAKAKGLTPSLDNLKLLTEPSEKELIMHIFKFNEVAKSAQENHKPSLMAHYLYQFVKAFNQFYVQVPVLKSENKDEIQARLQLIQAYGDTLKTGLSLLGMTPPEKM
jgi:arginyl-tRNA synthetase